MKKHGDDKQAASVLMLHARYRNQGGEERSFEEEVSLFERMGYSVHRIDERNSHIKSSPFAALSAIFNFRIFLVVLKSIRTAKPELIYVNNLWMALSPSVLWAARLARVPVLQAVRNYRLVCPSAKLTNEGRCLQCSAQAFPFSCIRSGCYNGSRVQTLIVALSAWSNKMAVAGWRKHKYLATSQITKDLLVSGGISAAKVSVRPNFVTPSLGPNLNEGAGVAFVGRLSVEKGIRELVTAWCDLPNPPMLTLVGDGPLAEFVSTVAAHPENRVEWLGSCAPSRVLEVLKSSSWTIVPSQWAEPFGRVAIESMSVGTPVIFTDGGALKEIVGPTGRLLPSISSEDLAITISGFPEASETAAIRRSAFQRFHLHYSDSAAVADMRKHIASVVKC